MRGLGLQGGPTEHLASHIMASLLHLKGAFFVKRVLIDGNLYGWETPGINMHQ